MAKASLKSLIAAELKEDLWPEIETLAEAVKRRYPASAVEAVLFYGSCLRDRNHKDKVVDFYALVHSYNAVYRGRWLSRLSNALLPPNVYYVECQSGKGETLRAKVAIVSMEDFRHLTSRRAFHPYLWGRFAQKVVLAGDAKAETAEEVASCLAAASVTLQRAALPLMGEKAFTAGDLWSRALSESYRTEIRAETRERASEIVSADAARYLAQTSAAAREERLPLEVLGDDLFKAKAPGKASEAKLAWFGRRILGRCLHVLRLAKGAYTYADGLDYILWKIGRHSGVAIEPRKWERRHPILAAPFLLIRLWRRGAFKKR